MDVATMMAQAISETLWEHNAYRPLPYHLGEPCERCWFDNTVDISAGAWQEYNHQIRTPRNGCNHGGGSDG